MESLRWILLAVGAVFVIAIYILGRSRRQRQHSMVDELEEDLPEFSAQTLDDVDEGVGEVRVVSSARLADDDFVSDEMITEPEDDIVDDRGSEVDNETDHEIDNISSDENRVAGADEIEEKAQDSSQADIIVLYILAKGDRPLIGSQVNSSAQAMGLRFGAMNIFHYQSDGRRVFSLANMLEPGAFDADTIHDLKTTGLTVFMQIQSGKPLDDLTEMLQRSYQLAGLLDARLCNHKRKPLTEQDAENYRTQVRNFITR